MSFWRDAGDWRVLTVRADSPAARAGVQIGWQLVAIDGTPVDTDFRSSLDHDSVLRFVDENRRTHQLTLRGALLDPDPDRRARRLPDGTLVLALDIFQPGAERKMRSATTTTIICRKKCTRAAPTSARGRTARGK